MKYPSIIQNLIECFKKFPGIGEKSAERMALSVLEIDKETIDLFAKSLKDSKTKIRRCENCNNLSEEEKKTVSAFANKITQKLYEALDNKYNELYRIELDKKLQKEKIDLSVKGFQEFDDGVLIATSKEQLFMYKLVEE